MAVEWIGGGVETAAPESLLYCGMDLGLVIANPFWAPAIKTMPKVLTQAIPNFRKSRPSGDSVLRIVIN